jgi:threonine/homoserine/homoserine lactone efflux protein
MSRLANTNYILGAISFGGSLFLVYLACESLSYRPVNPDSNKGQSLIKKSIIANFLNPSPYVFWFTIGAPAIIKAYNENLLSAALFIIVFYAVLVGSKVVIAAATEGSKHFLNSRYYLLLIRSLGICLLLFALYFIKNGVAYFSITD